LIRLIGRLPETLVIAPQAPPTPSLDGWNWREYVKALAEFLVARYAKQRVVATGFNRGGLDVLRLVSAYPTSNCNLLTIPVVEVEIPRQLSGSRISIITAVVAQLAAGLSAEMTRIS
jgi:hypothetical protein